MTKHNTSKYRGSVPSAFLLAVLLMTGCGDGSNNNDGSGNAFVFSQTPASGYTRVDRMGMPAVATVLIQSANKNAYNQADPADDVAGTFVPDIVAVIDALHMALDDDLMALALTPCTGGAAGSCVAQGAPLILPDSIRIDSTMPSGFPNGRRLPDQVIDVTLAVLLLDLGVMGQDATTLAGVPLNPPANDLAFTGTFPYLAPAH